MLIVQILQVISCLELDRTCVWHRCQAQVLRAKDRQTEIGFDQATKNQLRLQLI